MKRASPTKPAIGQRYARLVIVGLSKGDKVTVAECQCDCGATTRTKFGALTAGRTVSCGCSRVKHGARCYGPDGQRVDNPTYRTWYAMRQRCLSPTHKDYPRWGGSGVTICERWSAFANFLADMGERPKGMSIDRIDNAKGYEPGNCRWATASQQTRNRSSTVIGEENAARIRELAAQGVGHLEIAKQLGTHRDLTRMVVQGKIWRPQ